MVILLAFVVATAGIAFAFLDRTSPDPSSAVGGTREVSGFTSTPSAEASPHVTTVVPPSESGLCSAVPTAPTEVPVGAQTEAVAEAVAADYRFEGTLASSVGAVPNLAEFGNDPGGFTDDAALGRTVLRFAGGGGLVVAPPNAAIQGGTYSIELVFRLDHVNGYRKLIDFKMASDNGLYDLDGCLTFYPEEDYSLAGIAAESWVQVVLTRDASARITVYLNGVRELSFHDTRGRAVIDAAEALRFFMDDSITNGEYSSGAVSRIRLFDRPLTAAEVATIACTELPPSIDLEPGLCFGP